MIVPEFKYSQCEQGGFLPGCHCPYCQEYAAIRGPWEAGLKGTLEKGFEIYVIRVNNRLGHASWGWFGDSKLLISTNCCAGTVWQSSEEIFDKLLTVAIQIAARLNAEEANEL